MRRNGILRFWLLIVGISLLMLDILVGQVVIPFADFWHFLIGDLQNQNFSNYIIIGELRLPKAIAAFIIGGGLSVSGLLLQTQFRNPLADSYILGISSGASLGVAIFVLLGGYSIVQFAFLGSYSLALFSSIGAFLLTLLVLSFASKVRDNISLLLIGVMFGSISTSIVSVLQFYSDANNLQRFQIWTFGSLNGVNKEHLYIMIPVIVLCAIFAYFLSKQLNSILLNEKYATSLGINIRNLKLAIIVLTSLITGITTAFAGPIGFVGMAVPHLSRIIFRTNDHRILIPNAFFLGASILLMCDFISQLPILPVNLPINSVTALFGAPIIIWVILKNRKMKGDGF